MKNGKLLRILGGILAVLGLAGVGLMTFAGSAMIVALGIRVVTGLLIAGGIAAGVGALAVTLGFVPPITKYFKNKADVKLLEDTRREDRKQFSDYAKDSLNPEKTRMRLELLRRNNPSLSDLVERCLTQMDAIDTYQARHKSLLEANDAIYLEDTIEVIDNSERRMCRNFRNIINCCILVEDTDKGVESLDNKIIEDSLADNEEELSTVNTLLKYSVAYINNYNRSGVSDRSELDAWLKVIKESTGENSDVT